MTWGHFAFHPDGLTGVTSPSHALLGDVDDAGQRQTGGGHGGGGVLQVAEGVDAVGIAVDGKADGILHGDF